MEAGRWPLSAPPCHPGNTPTPTGTAERTLDEGTRVSSAKTGTAIPTGLQGSVAYTAAKDKYSRAMPDPTPPETCVRRGRAQMLPSREDVCSPFTLRVLNRVSSNAFLILTDVGISPSLFIRASSAGGPGEGIEHSQSTHRLYVTFPKAPPRNSPRGCQQG